jgi:hypothetical protein
VGRGSLALAAVAAATNVGCDGCQGILVAHCALRNLGQWRLLP